MKSLGTRRAVALLAFLLAFSLAGTAQTSAAAAVTYQLPEPEWSYELPKGYSVQNALKSFQTADRVFFPLLKTANISPSQKRSSGLAYASVSRTNNADKWVYDYSDLAHDSMYSGSDVYYAKDGYSYFHKESGSPNTFIFSAVDPKGKLKWTKKIDYHFKLVMLDNGNVLLVSAFYSPAPGGLPLSFIEYDHNGKQIRKVVIKKGPFLDGGLKVLPNGYVKHDLNDTMMLYRGIDDLKTPILKTRSPVEVLPFSGGSFLVQNRDNKDHKIIAYDANGKKKWVRAIDRNAYVDIIGNKYLLKSGNLYQLFDQNNKRLGKQQFDGADGNSWNYRISPSGYILLESGPSSPSAHPRLAEKENPLDWEQDDIYILNSQNLGITYHLSLLSEYYNWGRNYFYAGNGELYVSGSLKADKILNKYILK